MVENNSPFHPLNEFEKTLIYDFVHTHTLLTAWFLFVFQGTNASALEKDIGPEQFPINEHYFGLVNVSTAGSCRAAAVPLAAKTTPVSSVKTQLTVTHGPGRTLSPAAALMFSEPPGQHVDVLLP